MDRIDYLGRFTYPWWGPYVFWPCTMAWQWMLLQANYRWVWLIIEGANPRWPNKWLKWGFHDPGFDSLGVECLTRAAVSVISHFEICRAWWFCFDGQLIPVSWSNHFIHGQVDSATNRIWQPTCLGHCQTEHELQKKHTRWDPQTVAKLKVDAHNLVN